MHVQAVILLLSCYMRSSMIFLDCPQGERDPTMLIYYNAIIMKQESCSIFYTGAVMTHHDSVLFQKDGATCVGTASLSCINVFCPIPGAPPELSQS